VVHNNSDGEESILTGKKSFFTFFSFSPFYQSFLSISKPFSGSEKSSRGALHDSLLFSFDYREKRTDSSYLLCPNWEISLGNLLSDILVPSTMQASVGEKRGQRGT